jgi:hypothetical protein
MSDDHKSPAERLLDLFVFGPAGLAITAAEEFPKFVEKGRHRVEGQIHTARLVGQFAVQMGRREVEQRVGDVLTRRPSGVPSAPGSGAAPSGDAPVHTPAPAKTDGRATADTAPETAPAPAPGPGVTTALSSNGTMASSALGIPGYDSLSASQVVQRLGGLSEAELESVRDHELAHRHRRTILNRVDQLLAGADTERG